MLYSGKNNISVADQQPRGQFVYINDERFYEIKHYDRMQPFFISLASDTDLWMYLASTGGLTAGRQSPEKALFPYYTDDKITEQYEQTGPKTILRVRPAHSVDAYLWEPFSERQAGVYDIERTISKSTVGNKVLFAEENKCLGLRFSYMWAPAERHGWVRRAVLENLSESEVEVELLDGLQNVLPAGVERKTQNEFSTLVDGYKKTELEGNIVLFRMEAILVDRAEPSESLRCNTVYTLGLDHADYLLSSRQLTSFRRGGTLEPETESKGVRGAVFAHTSITLKAGETKTWYLVCDVDKDAVEVRHLMHFIEQPDAAALIENAIAQSTDRLSAIVGQNDGVQFTADPYNDARHFANTLFNTMRGGYYLDNYHINAEAFAKHVALFNKAVAQKHAAFFASLNATIDYAELLRLVRATGDSQLVRLTLEYLPITFGRRHGDPSRPWNLFNIRVQDKEGNPVVSYQGNWRDIFQNWEALSLSYPGYINGIISKFLNATTVDGYNPYKVTSEGIDWEVPEPQNPWSNIGYWGDHQIIYLLKLLELSAKHDPEALQQMLNERLFAFANVPYRFKPYEQIVSDPKNTIRFDSELNKQILALIPQYGQDARLVLDAKGEVYLTTMIDKLLITLLAKMCNFVPYAGIWMNTLRPEWNDANNALVGNGASMVTTCYMLRFVLFLLDLLKKGEGKVLLSDLTYHLLISVADEACQSRTTATDAMGARWYIDGIGKEAEAYREKMYRGEFGKMVELDRQAIIFNLNDILFSLRQTIEANRRPDGLYHAYNLIRFTRHEIEITHLYEMLEGQVAVLSSGLLSAEQSADLLDAMRHSALYREDQRSYMLYPARRRRSFLEMNNIPQEARQSFAVQRLLERQQDIILEDEDGQLHFNGGFNNADFLEREAKREGVDDSDIIALKELYEQVFNHHAFTGRSGTFYKYEGLGCIYWHMVSKLLLAVGETILRVAPDASVTDMNRLKEHYRDIREGIGSHKQPSEYGSFPFDAYSHTPSMAGVQQPGMTGQVKEDIINRFFELGVSVDNGQLSFAPAMLDNSDFADGELCFTYCRVPVIYRQARDKGVELTTADGQVIKTTSAVISKEFSLHIFERDGYVKQITVKI